MGRVIRILVVDDNLAVRQGICALLRTEHDLEVVCDAGSGEQAVRDAGNFQPDIIVLDISMPGMDGLSAAYHIKRVSPLSEIVILSQHDSPDMVRFALRYSALGYVLKLDADTELVAAIRAVNEKKQYRSSRVASA